MKLLEIYKCELCGNVIEGVFEGKGGPLVCCGEEMKLLEENTVDAAKEKHIPVVTVEGDKVHVVVGSVEHPMTEEHYITFIEAISTEGTVFRKHLKPGQKPEFTFTTNEKIEKVREYCNLHGLWMTTEVK